MIKPDRQYWNIMKGIGIISVVMGHACFWAHDFVYLYHLPLFYFVSGFLYNEQKYGEDPCQNLVNRIRSSGVKYICIYGIIMLLHNRLTVWGLMPENTPFYDPQTMVSNLVLVLFGTANELMGGTLWFVPTLIASSATLGFIVSLSRKIERITGKRTLKFLFQMAVIVILTCVGWIVRGVLMPANMQVALAVMPFQWAGYVLRNYGRRPDNFTMKTGPCIAMLAITVAVLILVSRRTTLDLIFGSFYHGMYIVAFAGILMCMLLSVLVQKWAAGTRIFALFGRYSFWIMAFHFPLIKLLDKAVAVKIGDPDGRLYIGLPHAFDALWPVYLLLGIGIPTAGCILADYVKERTGKSIQKKAV